MENTRGKTGSSRLRIVESDSESELDDDNELSMSMKHAQLDEESDAGSDTGDIDQDSECDEQHVARKSPRGRGVQRLDDFSWSSSDDESDESYSSSSHTEPKSMKSLNKKSAVSKTKDSNLISSSTKTPTASKPNCTNTSAGGRSLHAKVKKRDFDISISDDSISLSSSDDDFSVIQNEKSPKEKKRFAWSFNKKRREYTIGGNEKLPAFSIPSDLYESLYDFQKDGVAWMAGLHMPKIGGILGDDMGMVSRTNQNHLVLNC